MKIAALQINPTIGALEANADKLLEFAKEAKSRGAEMAVASELIVCGYPPKDLLERSAFLEEIQKQNERIIENAPRDMYLVFGTVLPYTHGKHLHGNVALIVYNGKIIETCIKQLLPTYDVFDDSRYFQSGTTACNLVIAGIRYKFVICEDAWAEEAGNDRYDNNPLAGTNLRKTDILINLSGSPFTTYKMNYRAELFSSIAKKYSVDVLLVNQVGGNDELIFDGKSAAWGSDGVLRMQAKAFVEDIKIYDFQHPGLSIKKFGEIERMPVEESEYLYKALVLGVRDYVRKCGFNKVVIGLSGGIDSALTAVIAVEALGATNVLGVGMPSQYSSTGSIEDAHQLAMNIGIPFRIIPIKDIFNSYQDDLSLLLCEQPVPDEDVTWENVQARIRGNILMALSNRTGALVLTTGNKSEIAVGYCTLYGDMCGGLAVIADVPKTKVYAMAKWTNESSTCLSHLEDEIIPQNTIDKAPSAELAPGQKDSDSLPPYSLLDPLLEKYIEKQMSKKELLAEGFEEQYLDRIIGMIRRNEYKRKQMAPGLIVTSKAFGIGRRMPVANGFKE